MRSALNALVDLACRLPDEDPDAVQITWIYQLVNGIPKDAMEV